MKIKGIIANNLLMLKYLIDYVPLYVLGCIVIKILQGLDNVIGGVLLTKYVIDAVEYKRSFNEVLLALLLYLIFVILIQVTSSFFMETYASRCKQVLHRKMQMKLFKKAANIDISAYDNPKFYNDFVWAISEAEQRALSVFDSLQNLIMNLVSIAGVVAVIFTLDYIGIIFMTISFVFTFIINKTRTNINFKKWSLIKPIQRKRDYINKVFYVSDYAKELRLTAVKYKLSGDFVKLNHSINDIMKKYSIKLIALNFSRDFIFNALLFDGIYMMYLTYKVILIKVLSYGSFVALLNSTSKLKGSLQSLVEILPEFQEHSLYIDNFRVFLNYECKINDSDTAIEAPVIPKTLKLNNVSFTYEGAKAPILKNINIEIKPYEKIALVGYNGAGKTTLIKLLMRLYDVTEGEILLDNINIKEYKLKSYRKSIGTVFQDFQVFAVTLGENVAMDIVQEPDKDNIITALRLSGFEEKLNTLEEGIATHLTKEFDRKSVNLSGGENQKVAISRTFFRAHQLIILDEPSSALDPISEYELNNTMLEAAKDKTVIFISHRLSSTKMADRIYMLKDGEVVEAGSHDELMSKNGRYAEMFNYQAEKYRIS
jgi:ATP-binding cassette subfamily B protein